MNFLKDASPVEKLAARHEVRGFRCGEHSLDYFLRKYALGNQNADSSQTYIVHVQNVVIGYYSLVFGAVSPEDSIVPPTGHYPVPVMRFARFAVDKKWQGQGLGTALLKDAFLRTLGAAQIAGLAAILVDAIDDKMVEFYQRYGFRLCPIRERQLMVSIGDVRQSILG